MQSNESAFHSGRARSAAEHSNQLTEMQQKTFEENALFHLVHGISFLNFFFSFPLDSKGFYRLEKWSHKLDIKMELGDKKAITDKILPKDEC